MPVALKPPKMFIMFIFSLYAFKKILQKSYLDISLPGFVFKPITRNVCCILVPSLRDQKHLAQVTVSSVLCDANEKTIWH